jgi:hypothetical protein
MPFSSHQHPSDELLSAYLAEAIDDPALQAAVSGHLHTCLTCREQVAQLHAITTLLAELPAPPLLRSFALTREELERLQRRPWYLRYQPMFRWSSAIAAVLLVLLGLDLLVSRPAAHETPAVIGVRQATPEPMVDAPVAAMSAPEERTAAAEPAAAATPEAMPAGKEVPTEESLGIMAATPEEAPTETAPSAAPAAGKASVPISWLLRLGVTVAGIVSVVSLTVGFLVPRLVARRASQRQ